MMQNCIDYILSMKYLSYSQLNGFENYRYSSIDSSPLSKYIMHPFWNRVVLLFPEWVAPNVLTLVGFLLTVLNFFIFVYLDPDLLAASPDSGYHIPVVIWLLAAILLFLAHTLDGIDGKQARRIGVSGPIGELFDHGLDSWSCYFIVLIVLSLTGRGEYGLSPNYMLLLLCNVWITFFMSHYEKYVTGVLFLPWGYDISQLCIFLMFVITYVGDYRIWHVCVLTQYSICLTHFIAIVMWLGGVVLTFPVSIYNIYISVRNGTYSRRAPSSYVAPWFSILVTFLVTWCVVFYKSDEFLTHHLRLFTYIVSIVVSNICCRLIVAQMSNTTVQFVNPLLLVYTAVSALVCCYWLAAYVTHVLWLAALLLTLLHVHYGVCVVRQMAEHFGVHLLSVRRQPAKSD